MIRNRKIAIDLIANRYARPVPEVHGDGNSDFGGVKDVVGFLVANFLSLFSPRKKRLKICHRKLHHKLEGK